MENEKVTDVAHVAHTITAASQVQQISQIDQTLAANPPGTHSTIADIYPVVRPAFNLIANLFPAGSVWRNALTEFVGIADVELGHEESSETAAASPKGKGRKK